MKVKQFMVPIHRIVTVDENLTLEEVSKIMLDKHIGSVVITRISDKKEDHSPRALGIFTKTDVMRGYTTGGPDAGKKKVGSFAIPKLLICHENTSRGDVAKYMVEAGVHHMLVNDDKKKIIGLVTAFDLTREIFEDSKDKFPYFRKLFGYTEKDIANLEEKVSSSLEYLLPQFDDAYYYPPIW